MKTIRANTFETNSSSTHSMIILTEEEEQKLDSGELYLSTKYNTNLITKEEAYKIFLKAMESDNYIQDPEYSLEENIKDYLENCDDRYELPCSLDDWTYEDYLVIDSNKYTSPSGDKLVIISKYGNDY